MNDFDEALAEAMMMWSVVEGEEEPFMAGFEAGYLAGIDRGMEVEHELAEELRVQHDPSL